MASILALFCRAESVPVRDRYIGQGRLRQSAVVGYFATAFRDDIHLVGGGSLELLSQHPAADMGCIGAVLRDRHRPGISPPPGDPHPLSARFFRLHRAVPGLFHLFLGLNRIVWQGKIPVKITGSRVSLNSILPFSPPGRPTTLLRF